MKLFVLKNRLEQEPLYRMGVYYLYHLPISEYKKQILKGDVCMDLENILPYACMRYARDVLKGRFEVGEEFISTDAHHSLVYANILNKRFELGEEAISGEAYHSFNYAKCVLKGRFILGEEMIKQSEYKEEYEKLFDIKL